MKSIHLRARVDPGGTLKLTMPPDMAGRDVELIVVFDQPAPATNGESHTETNGWPPGFFERTAGAWQGEPLVRPAQGEYEERDPLA